MAYKQSTEYHTNQYKKPNYKYSDKEMEMFGIEMEKYREVITLKDGRVVKPVNFRQYMIDMGALNKEGAVIIENIAKFPVKGGRSDEYYFDCSPIMYEQLDSKIEQWKDWKDRKKYAETKRLENYEKMAQEL